MRFYYDWEFLDKTHKPDEGAWAETRIAPLAIGMIAETGAEYYAVLGDAPWFQVHDHAWLMENVWPFLPTIEFERGPDMIDKDHPEVKPARQVAAELETFFTECAFPTPAHESEEIELVGWYSAYDHVSLMSLWGEMNDRPEYLPMYTVDLKQEHDRLHRIVGVKPPKPPQEDEHHALADAKWNFDKDVSLRAFELAHGLR